MVEDQPRTTTLERERGEDQKIRRVAGMDDIDLRLPRHSPEQPGGVHGGAHELAAICGDSPTGMREWVPVNRDALNLVLGG